MKLRLLIGSLVLLILCFGSVNAQQIYISSFDGAWDEDTKVKTNVPVTWTLGINSSTIGGIQGSSNGFRVFLSSDGTVAGMLYPGPGFTAPVGDSISGLFETYGYNYTINYFGVDGFGADTIGFGGVSFGPPSTNEGDAWTITTQVDETADTYLCLDSSYYPPGGAWLWVRGDGGGNYNPTWDGPYCYLIENYGLPAYFENAPDSLFFIDHCATATYQFEAIDPDPENCPPYDGSVYFSMVDDGGSGSTITEDGIWSMPANMDAHLNSPYTITIKVEDACGDGTECSFDVSFGNNTPMIDCGGLITVCKDSPIIPHQVIATDADACDALTFSLIGQTAIGPAAIDPVTGIFTYHSDNADGGYVHTFDIEVTDGDELTYCIIDVSIMDFGEPYEIQIEKTHETFQGQHEYVDVTVKKGSEDMWGFDILIAYDASAISFQVAVPGSVYSACGWEYFTYRYGADGNCGSACPSGMIRVIGFAETNNGPNHPDCFNATGETLFTLDFLVTDDRTFECMYIPIRFFWMDCGDNAISYHELADVANPYSQIMGISRWVFDYEGMEITGEGTFPTFFGVPTDPCMEGDKDVPIRFVDFINGGIDIICADSIDGRGDLNMNGVDNEIADAVLYTNYFVFGIGVFEHYQAQVAASDVNADGITLSVADLVYLIRIVVGDALPIPKIVPVAVNLIIDEYINVDKEMGAASISIEGNVSPELLVDNMDIKYSYNAEENITHVLVYSFAGGHSFTGEFIKPNGKVLDIELATYEGAPVKVEMLPSTFELKQNYPNPFNPTTTIEFSLPPQSEWQLNIYNVTGQEVFSTSGISTTSEIKIEWEAGSKHSSGIYFYRLDAGEISDTKKMILIK